MPSTKEMEGTSRRALHVFYVLDTSRSMEGDWIASLNKAMGETTEILRKKAARNADALLKVAVLEFNSGCEWIQPQGPEDMEDFVWKDLSAGGLTDMGEALKELDSKLSRKEFLSSATGAYVPVIIFMTDGYATDNYRKALQHIRGNRWFCHAVKIGFALGDYPDVAMIADIVGSCEAVVRTSDMWVFERLVQFATQTATMMCSRSRTGEDEVSGSDIVRQAVEEGVAPKEAVDIHIPGDADSREAGSGSTGGADYWEPGNGSHTGDADPWEPDYGIDDDDMDDWTDEGW